MIHFIKEVKPFGKDGAHITLPKSYIGKKIEIGRPSEGVEFLTKDQIELLIEQKIEDAQQGH